MTAPRRQHAFTLVELIVAVAVAAILLTIGVPNFRDFILRQRVKSVQAQLVTDLQYARSEAVARNNHVWTDFSGDTSKTCYTIYASELPDADCSCLKGSGSACTASPSKEIRTVSVPKSDSVTVTSAPDQPPNFAFDYVNGGLRSNPVAPRPSDLELFQIHVALDETRKFVVSVGKTGRTTVCTPAGANLGGTTCPP